MRLDYELQGGRGIARVTLREGQARRLRTGDLPPLDRPLRFAVRRGNHPPIMADTLDDLRDALDRLPSRERDDSPRTRRQPHQRGRGRGPGGRGRRR